MKKRHKKKVERSFMQLIKNVLEQSVFKSTIIRADGEYLLLVEDGCASEFFSIEELISMLPISDLLFRIDITLLLKRTLEEGGAQIEQN